MSDGNTENGAGQVPTYGGKKKDQKVTWTLKRCLRFARRFDSVTAWQKGHPSSFKAASSHGWQQDCTAHMSDQTAPTTGKVTSINKARGRKPAKLPQSA